MNELLVMLLVALLGALLILSGIFLLAGLAWTLIAAGVSLFAAAGIIRRGVYRV